MAAKKKNSPSFEESLESLRKIVSELEQGKLTLSDSLEKYEVGVRSLKECFDRLQEAQRKIEKLVKIDENGNLITEPFEDKASHPSMGGNQGEQGYRAGGDTVNQITSVSRTETAAEAVEKPRPAGGTDSLF